MSDISNELQYDPERLVIEDEVFYKAEFIAKHLDWELPEVVGTLVTMWRTSQKMKVYECDEELLKFITEIEHDEAFSRFCSVCSMPEMNFLRKADKIELEPTRSRWRICGNKERINKVLEWEGREVKK
jgi:hypothetical protein